MVLYSKLIPNIKGFSLKKEVKNFLIFLYHIRGLLDITRNSRLTKGDILVPKRVKIDPI